MPPSRSPSPENDVFGISSMVIPEREAKRAQTSMFDLDGLLTTPLILHEDVKEGCGGQLWPAGVVLSRYLLSCHRSGLRDKSILELGAGGGLVGLAVALGCEVSRPIHITDQEPMLALMQRNIDLNKLSDKVQASVYDWGEEPPQQLGLSGGYPDVLLAADCVYFEPAFPLLLHTLRDLVGPNTTCYFCFKKRRKADLRFIKDMKKAFDVVQVKYNGQEKDVRDSIFLFQVKRKDE
ncbi:hypothetical protein DV737_g3735, partial [Chaetothyriales sp. CBS 132003]